MKSLIFITILIFFSVASFAQYPNINYLYSKKTADSLFSLELYNQAYSQYVNLVKFKDATPRDFYRAAYCSYSLGKTKMVRKYLNKTIAKGILYPSEKTIQTDGFLNKNVQYIKIFKEKIRLQTLENIKIRNQSLFDSLIKRGENDQKFRKIDKSKYSMLTRDSVIQIQNSIDSSNQQWLLTIVEKYGWPGYKEVGYEGDQTAWLIVQHADANIPFQKKVLEIIKKELVSNNSNSQNFAYLTDRILINTEKKQIYGTQFNMDRTINNIILKIKPVENEFLLNTLRDYVGMSTIEEYLLSATKRMKNKYGITN